MRIRAATVADIPILMAIETHAVTAAHWSQEQYVAAISGVGVSRVILVIEDPVIEQQVIEGQATVRGFLAARTIGEEWEIENLAVAGPARRRGLGTRLLGEFLDLARKQRAQMVFLEVRESNLAARRLYEKWAFVESGRRKSYYRDPEDDAVTCRFNFS